MCNNSHIGHFPQVQIMMDEVALVYVRVCDHVIVYAPLLSCLLAKVILDHFEDKHSLLINKQSIQPMVYNVSLR